MKLSRVFTVVKKDVQENWMVFVIAIMIPLLLVLMTLRSQTTEFRTQDYQGSTESLLNNDVDILVDEVNQTIYSREITPSLYHHLSKTYSTPTGIEISVLGEDQAEKVFSAFLMAILFWIMSIITQPILMLSESQDGLHDALMMTNLSFNEYQVAKMGLSFISSFIILIAFSVILGGGIGLVGLVLVLALALMSVMISRLVAVYSRDVDRLILINTPLAMVFVFLEVYLYISGTSYSSPLQKLFRSLLTNELPPSWLIALMVGISVIGYGLSYHQTRVQGRNA